MRIAGLTVLSISSMLLLALAIQAEEVRKKPPAVTLEVAPRDLGQIFSTGDLLFAGADKGKELYVYDASIAQLSRYLESGDKWGDPVLLETGTLTKPPRVDRLAMSDGVAALSGQDGLYLYDTDGAYLSYVRIFLPGDVTAVGSSREWALSLINLPNPVRPNEFLARRVFGEDVPRLIFVNEDATIVEKGLFEDVERRPSPSAAAGRSPRLAWGDDTLFVAELSNYVIYRFDRHLDLKTTFREPELMFEEGRDEKQAQAFLSEKQAELEKREPSAMETSPGRNLAAQESQARPEDIGRNVAVHYDPVIYDIAWSDRYDQLVLLLDRGVVGENYSLDMLNPLTGEIRRIQIKAPEEFKDGAKLTQLVAGSSFLWIRGYKGDSPTFRIDYEVFQNSQHLRLPDVSFVDSLDSPEENASN